MSVEQQPTTPAEPEAQSPRLGLSQLRLSGFQTGSAILAITGLAAVSLVGIVGNNAKDKIGFNNGLPPAPASFDPGFVTSAPASRTAGQRPSTSETPTPSRPKSAISTSLAPVGRLLSFHFESKSRGLSKDERLLPMSCPTACETVNGGPDFALDPPSFYDLFYWKADERIITGHTSEVPGVDLAAQWFKDIRPGDTVTMHTTTGNFTYVDEKLPACAATTKKGSAEFPRVYGSLTKDQLMFLTCAITPKNDKNTIHIFNREGSKYSPQQFPCAASA